MVSKDELRDWLAENARKSYAKELEEFIDCAIKKNALAGSMSFYIPTGEYTRDGSRKTPFYDLWEFNGLSKENRKIVQKGVINRYKEFGFDVEETNVDCGWHNHYFALKFKNIDKVIIED